MCNLIINQRCNNSVGSEVHDSYQAIWETSYHLESVASASVRTIAMAFLVILLAVEDMQPANVGQKSRLK